MNHYYKKRIIITGLIFTLLLSGGLIANRFSYYSADASTITPKNTFSKRYVYYSMQNSITNLAEKTKLLGVMESAAAAGYNGIVLHGGQLYNYPYDQTIKDGFTTIINRARELNLAIIPEHFDQYDPTYENKNIEEAIPVKNTEFLVQNNTAQAQTNPQVTVPNGNFESWESSSPNTPADSWVDGPGTVIFRDSSINHTPGGSSSILVLNPYKSANNWGRIFLYEPKYVDPNRSYQFSIWIKTQDFKQPEKIRFIIEGRDAAGKVRTLYQTEDFAGMTGSAPIAPTQNWTQYKGVFNSLDSTQVTLAFGAWGTTSTESVDWKAWFDDAQITEAGLFNTVVRSSCPVTVKSSNETITYREGSDYVVGNQTLTIPAGSAITNGSKLKVSWCMKGMVANYTLIPSNASHEDFFTSLRDGVGRLNDLLSNPAGFMIAYDEWRVANWDPASRTINQQVNGIDQEMTGGEYIAYTMQKTEDVIQQARPDAQLYVWNDMFDPYHNAEEKYYMVNGPIGNVMENGTQTHKGSWEGVSANTIIMNWNSQREVDSRTNEPKTLSSLKFFAGRGHHQIIAGYYESLDNVKWWLDSLDTLESSPSGITGIDGFMYTTWEGDYSQLAAVADMIKSRGRWGSELEITKSSSSSSASSGDIITYQLVIKNTSATTVTNAKITDPIPAGTTFIEADNGGVYNGQDAIWQPAGTPWLQSISPGSAITLTLKVKVN